MHLHDFMSWFCPFRNIISKFSIFQICIAFTKFWGFVMSYFMIRINSPVWLMSLQPSRTGDTSSLKLRTGVLYRNLKYDSEQLSKYWFFLSGPLIIGTDPVLSLHLEGSWLFKMYLLWFKIANAHYTLWLVPKVHISCHFLLKGFTEFPYVCPSKF